MIPAVARCPRHGHVSPCEGGSGCDPSVPHCPVCGRSVATINARITLSHHDPSLTSAG